jgi:hypothetical protein
MITPMVRMSTTVKTSVEAAFRLSGYSARKEKKSR